MDKALYCYTWTSFRYAFLLLLRSYVVEGQTHTCGTSMALSINQIFIVWWIDFPKNIKFVYFRQPGPWFNLNVFKIKKGINCICIIIFRWYRLENGKLKLNFEYVYISKIYQISIVLHCRLLCRSLGNWFFCRVFFSGEDQVLG